MSHFSKYGGAESISLKEFHEIPAGDLWARAEQSGCEGCYCEIARWSNKNHRWERFAFAKFFGGEHPEAPEAGSIETAALYARDINRGEIATVIHGLPNYEG
jgi:hypothetical protein